MNYSKNSARFTLMFDLGDFFYCKHNTLKCYALTTFFLMEGNPFIEIFTRLNETK